MSISIYSILFKCISVSSAQAGSGIVVMKLIDVKNRKPHNLMDSGCSFFKPAGPARIGLKY